MIMITMASLNLLAMLNIASAVLYQDSPSSDQITPRHRGDPIHVPLKEFQMPQHIYVRMWITEDGHIRQELLTNGRYDEARGNRQSAYQGRYEVAGNLIYYWDDTGFSAEGKFVDTDTLHHGGMIFYRQK